MAGTAPDRAGPRRTAPDRSGPLGTADPDGPPGAGRAQEARQETQRAVAGRASSRSSAMAAPQSSHVP
jgi:hypothetical protein